MNLRIIFILISLGLANSLIAQLGVQFNTNLHQIRYNGNVLSAEFDDDNQLGSELALSYWFRLPNHRVEFIPTIYAGFSPELANSQNIIEFGTEMKTNIYPFDFNEDCDCPTFGKQGTQLQKGLFIQLTLGYANYRKPESLELLGSLAGVTYEETLTSGFTFGGGVGLDFGVTNLITVTPMIGVRRGTVSITDPATTDSLPFEPSEIKITTWQAGVRALFRLDYKNF